MSYFKTIIILLRKGSLTKSKKMKMPVNARKINANNYICYNFITSLLRRTLGVRSGLT